MTPVIEAKRAALAEHKRISSEKNLQILRIARSKAQQTARRCANGYWTELNEDIQSAAITGNIRGVYHGIKKALGPTPNKTAPLRSSKGEVISDRGHQLGRWVEHYFYIYPRENIVSPSALDAVECLPTMEELDTEPTLEELSKAIDSNGTPPLPTPPPPRPTKALQDHLTAFTACTPLSVLARRSLQQDMRDAKIITLFKNKGERSDCNNYRGIFLLSVTGKVFAKVILIRLQKLAERVCPITVWLPSWKVNNRRDSLPSPTPGEVQRTTDAPVNRFH